MSEPQRHEREDPQIAAKVRAVMEEIRSCTPGARLADVPTLFAFGPIYRAIAEAQASVAPAPQEAEPELFFCHMCEQWLVGVRTTHPHTAQGHAVSAMPWSALYPAQREAISRVARLTAEESAAAQETIGFTLTQNQAEYVLRVLQTRDVPDHACRQCVGDNAMSNDFVCLRHRLDAWQASFAAASAGTAPQEEQSK